MKPREFWIKRIEDNEFPFFFTEICRTKKEAYEQLDFNNSVHVQEVIPEREAAIEQMVSALEFYSQTRRDTSFSGWEKEWKYIEAKSDSDYNFYPNHEIAIIALEAWRKVNK